MSQTQYATQKHTDLNTACHRYGSLLTVLKLHTHAFAYFLLSGSNYPVAGLKSRINNHSACGKLTTIYNAFCSLTIDGEPYKLVIVLVYLHNMSRYYSRLLSFLSGQSHIGYHARHQLATAVGYSNLYVIRPGQRICINSFLYNRTFNRTASECRY